MLIIHGTYTEQKDVGVVGDRCPACGNLRVLRVRQIVQKSHLYFVPIGSGQVVGAAVTCTGCDSPAEWRPETYAEFIPEDEAGSMSLGAILWKTNPRLAERVANRMRLERDAKQWAGGPGDGPDPRVGLAFAKLAELADERADRLRTQLDRWEKLDVSIQTRLLRDVDALAVEQDEYLERVRFINVIAGRLKTGGDGAMRLLIFVVLLGLGGAVFQNELAGTRWLGAAMCALLAMAGALSLLLPWQYRRFARRRFFRDVFLPEAEKRAIPVTPLLEMLSRINPADKAIDERIRGLARTLPILKDVLANQNRDLDIPAESMESAAQSRAMQHPQ